LSRANVASPKNVIPTLVYAALFIQLKISGLRIAYAACGNRSSLLVSGHRPSCPLLYRSGDFPQIAFRALCDFGRMFDQAVSTATGIRPVRAEGRGYSAEPDQKSGEKSKTKPLCQLSVRPNPPFMSPGPGKWGRMWEWWWACGLWASELYSINLP